jgi:hypothetical protein
MSALQEPAPEISRERVARELEEVYLRPEFDDSKGPIQRFFEWLLDTLQLDVSPGVVGDTITTVLWIVGGLLLVLLVVVIVREVVPAWRRRRQRGDEPDEADRAGEVARRVAALRAEARAARAAGDPRRALRLGLFALVVGLGERGDLRYRDAWTNRELLDRGRPSQRTRALLEPLILELEAKEFGHAPIDEGDLDRLEQLCERWLGPLREAAA